MCIAVPRRRALRTIFARHVSKAAAYIHGHLELLFLLATLTVPCTACVAPEPSVAQLQQQDLARLTILSPAAWNLGAPPGRGIALEIVSVDGRDACTPTSCPTELSVPTGSHSLSFRCLLLMGNLRLPQAQSAYTGDFLAGHRYAVQPASVVPDCKLRIRDTTVSP